MSDANKTVGIHDNLECEIGSEHGNNYSGHEIPEEIESDDLRHTLPANDDEFTSPIAEGLRSSELCYDPSCDHTNIEF